MSFKKRCPYCNNKDNHTLIPRGSKIDVYCGCCGELLLVVGGKLAKKLKEAQKWKIV